MCGSQAIMSGLYGNKVLYCLQKVFKPFVKDIELGNIVQRKWGSLNSQSSFKQGERGQFKVVVILMEIFLAAL